MKRVKIIYKLKGQAAYSTECSDFVTTAQTFKRFQKKKITLEDLDYFVRVPLA